jgi:thiol-disulfide isomerase/thioredoxin
MENTIGSFGELQEVINGNSAVLIYVSTKTCNVCKVLKPKLKDLIKTEFPEVIFYYLDAEENKESAAQLSVFAVPTVLVYFEGKEYLRKSRSFSVELFGEEIERPYNMLFS